MAAGDVEAGTVHIDGKIYPVPGKVNHVHLGVFERRVTTGPPGPDDDDYISSLVISDLSGGMGVERFTTSDTNRYHYGLIDARGPGQICLPPLVTATRPTANDSDTLYPMGDIPGVAEEFYVAVKESPTSSVVTSGRVWSESILYDWDDTPEPNDDNLLFPVGDFPGSNIEFYLEPDQPSSDGESWIVMSEYYGGSSNANLYAWQETVDTWRATDFNLSDPPVGKPAIFRGSTANAKAFIPKGDPGGWSSVYALSDSTLTTAGTSTPIVQWFTVWDNKLYMLGTDGKIQYSTDGTTFTALTDPTTGSDLQLEPGRTMRKMLSFFDRQGISQLYIVTDRDVWTLEINTPKLQATQLSFPPHPSGANGATVWRPGEDLWVSLGGAAIRFTPAGVIVPLAGPGANSEGLPAAYRGSIKDLEPEFAGLYCLIQGVSGSSTSSMFLYTGIGWHQIWEAPNTTTTVTWAMVSKASSAYRLWWGAGSYAYTIELDAEIVSARQSYLNTLRKFATSGFFYSTRFDAGMQGFDKLALRATVLMANASTTETVTLSYAVNTAPTTFVSLGTVTATGKTVFQFGTLVDTIYPGIPFNWLQFKVELARGSTTTNTPIIEAIILHYVKIRQDTRAFTFTINLADKQFGRGGQAMHDEIDALIEARTAFSFRHRRETFRAWIAGVDVTEDTGNTDANSITVSLLAIPQD